MSCFVCKQPEIDRLEFEAGNNAEVQVSMPVCQTHWDECEQDEWAFRDKHADRIEQEAAEHLVDLADHYRDEAKYL